MKFYITLLLIFPSLGFGQDIDYRQQIKNRPFISVSDKPYLAKGDGNSDDTAAIKAAMVAGCSIPGSVIYFPTGIYVITVSVKANFILPTCSNLTITGGGTIKIKDNAGSFFGIFGGMNISNFEISNINIDENSSNNPLVSTGDTATYPRILVQAGSGGTGNVSIHNLHLTNVRAEWAIFCAALNCSVKDNLVDNVGGGSVTQDSSILYIEGGAKNATVSGNKVIGISRGANLANTGIEVQSDTTVSGNVIRDMLTGINVVGQEMTTTKGSNINNNSISGAFSCIVLWSSSSRGASGFGLSNVNVQSNNCILNQRSYLTLGGSMSGIRMDYNAILPFNHIKINNNNITFDLSSINTDPIDSASIGIGYWDALNNTTIMCDDCDFSHNTVVNSPAVAFRYSANGKNIKFDDETAINPGSSPNATLADPYRSGYLLGNTVALQGYFSIKNGIVIDDQATSRFKYGIYLGSAVGSNPNINVEGLSITCIDLTCASLTSALYNSTNSNALIRATVYAPNSKVLPTPSAYTGTTIFSVRESLTYTWDSVSWNSLTPHLVAPIHQTGGSTTCGTAPSFAGTDFSGIIVPSGGAVTSCTVTFGTAFVMQPAISFTQLNNPASGTGLTFTGTGSPAFTAGFTVTGTALQGGAITWNIPITAK